MGFQLPPLLLNTDNMVTYLTRKCTGAHDSTRKKIDTRLVKILCNVRNDKWFIKDMKKNVLENST